jgi:hypothetical protein
LLCDLGYGVPKEARPRKEKILAIARQLVNFLTWQHDAYKKQIDNNENDKQLAKVVLVDCNDDNVQSALLERMKELWYQSHSDDEAFPSNLMFSKQRSLQDYTVSNQNNDKSSSYPSLVYLSPDADQVLNVTKGPPRIAVIGMLIDRRIQVDRSLHRSASLTFRALAGQLYLDWTRKNPLM